MLLSLKLYSFAIFGVLIGFLGQSERFLQVLDMSSIESRADCWCLDVRSAVAGSRVGLTGGRSGRLSFRDISRRVCCVLRVVRETVMQNEYGRNSQSRRKGIER